MLTFVKGCFELAFQVLDQLGLRPLTALYFEYLFNLSVLMDVALSGTEHFTVDVAQHDACPIWTRMQNLVHGCL